MKLQTSEQIEIKGYLPICIAIVCIIGTLGTMIDILTNGRTNHFWFFICFGCSCVRVCGYIYWLNSRQTNTKGEKNGNK